MRKTYQRLMHDWETRMTTRDTNRIVRPFQWGTEWAQSWPGVNGDYVSPAATSEAQERFLVEVNKKIIAHSGVFFDYRVPDDFHLRTRTFPGERSPTEVLTFTSAAKSGDFGPEHSMPAQAASILAASTHAASTHPANDIVSCRWYPAKMKSKKAVVLLPHWNSKPHSYIALCRIFAKMGISTLRLSLPYHDSRLPAETQRSDYAVSPNIARTLDATRQAVIDTRSCFDWLQQQGFEDFGIVGTSLGSCYAFLASAHDERIRVNVFNHASTHFADVVWTGQSTRHVRAGIESEISLDRLRAAWDGISPINYFQRFEGKRKKVLVIYATYDLTFLPELSREVVRRFGEHGIDHDVRVLPCGHYSTGETPFKFIDGWHIGKFLRKNL